MEDKDKLSVINSRYRDGGGAGYRPAQASPPPSC